mmetsp:Transcript_4235/g.15224  ORF Transcript_4235/g.15224 Transcript_4235/m.15224 type:complete len:201 (+) Transcript_4235:1150-1752(+)
MLSPFTTAAAALRAALAASLRPGLGCALPASCWCWAAGPSLPATPAAVFFGGARPLIRAAHVLSTCLADPAIAFGTLGLASTSVHFTGLPELKLGRLLLRAVAPPLSCSQRASTLLFAEATPEAPPDSFTRPCSADKPAASPPEGPSASGASTGAGSPKTSCFAVHREPIFGALFLRDLFASCLATSSSSGLKSSSSLEA